MLLSANMIRVHDVFGIKGTFDVPQELRPEGLGFMARVGHYLISRFEYYKRKQ